MLNNFCKCDHQEASNRKSKKKKKIEVILIYMYIDKSESVELTTKIR